MEKDLGFENFDGISSFLDFEFAAQSLLRLPSFFPQSIGSSIGFREKEYMKLDVGKVVDSMTRGSCIPTDSVKSGDDYSSMFIVLGLGHILSRIIPIRHIRLLYIAGSELSKSNEIGVKYGFILGLKKLLLLKSISQFTKEKNKQTNKQTNKQRKRKRKRKQAYARVDLDLYDS